MVTTRHAPALLLCAALSVCACGSERDGDASSLDAGPDGGSEAEGKSDASTPVTPSLPVTITGHVNGGLFTMTRPAVSVCLVDEPDYDCVETDEIGLYAIEAPGNARVALLFEGEGLVPTLRPFLTFDEDLELGNTRVAEVGGLTPIAEGLGVEQDPEKGVVLFSGVEFVWAELVPASGERYFVSMGGRLIDGAEWIEPYGSGGFLNVDPGERALRFSRPHAFCAFNSANTLSGWPDPDDHTLAIVPVLAGHITSTITMDCGAP